MSYPELFALFSAMFLLALIPGPAVFAIIARTFASGFSKGLYMTLGILMGDYIFITLALFGLTAVAELMGGAFVVVKYLSAAYLCWLGYSLLRSNPQSLEVEHEKESGGISSFLAGLFITLGNPKAILFYIGFFPAFIDVATVNTQDVINIMIVATLAFGSVNLGYVYMALRAKRLFTKPSALNVLNKTAGGVMLSTGLVLATRSD